MKPNQIFSLTSCIAGLLICVFITQTNAKNTNDQHLVNKNAEQILLAQVHKSGINVQHYLVSEKYDGVRGLWDGKALHTRTGRLIYLCIKDNVKIS